MLLTHRQGDPLGKILVGRNALHDGVGLAVHDVAHQGFFDHGTFLLRYETLFNAELSVIRNALQYETLCNAV